MLQTLDRWYKLVRSNLNELFLQELERWVGMAGILEQNFGMEDREENKSNSCFLRITSSLFPSPLILLTSSRFLPFPFGLSLLSTKRIHQYKVSCFEKKGLKLMVGEITERS